MHQALLGEKVQKARPGRVGPFCFWRVVRSLHKRSNGFQHEFLQAFANIAYAHHEGCSRFGICQINLCQI